METAKHLFVFFSLWIIASLCEKFRWKRILPLLDVVSKWLIVCWILIIVFLNVAIPSCHFHGLGKYQLGQCGQFISLLRLLLKLLGMNACQREVKRAFGLMSVWDLARNFFFHQGNLESEILPHGFSFSLRRKKHQNLY